MGTRSRTAYVEKLKGSTPKGLTQNSGGTVGSGRVENLKPWAKGVSGNPGGRPRTAPITELLRELLQKPCPGDTQNRTYAHKIAEAMLKRTSQGDVRAAREVADRTEGGQCKASSWAASVKTAAKTGSRWLRRFQG